MRYECRTSRFELLSALHAEEEGSVQELESLDPQKRELLEARFLGRVSGMWCK